MEAKITQSVKLVAKTVPIDIPEISDAKDFIGYCAKVSNPQHQTDPAEKLLKYCLKKKHWSIFEMVDLVFEINTTRDIGRQILRHRSFNFQEFSQRYAVVDEDKFYSRETRLQDTKNRQASIETEDQDLIEEWRWYQQRLVADAVKVYKWALAAGIAKEQARVVLPEGLTPSTMYMKGSLRSWIHYCQLRMGVETQKEHRQIARMIWDVIILHFPFLSDYIEQ